MKDMFTVTFYMRKPGFGFSIERVFLDIARALPEDIKASFCYNKYESAGLFRRLYDLCRAPLHQGDINHITGDIHFVSYCLKKQRTVITIHDTGMHSRDSGVRSWLYWLFWLRLPAWSCKVIVAISEATRDDIIRLLPDVADKVRVIPDPVSSEFRPSPKAFNLVRPRILHIGAAKNKNLERHVAALRGMPCELVVIGRLSDQQVQMLNVSGVSYMSFHSLTNNEVVEQYRLADIVLFASTFEGFGLPIAEGQAVGRPVITSNLAPMSEVASGAACLVDPFDTASIRAGIEKVIADEEYRNLLVLRGFENAKRFEARKVAEQYAALYRELMETA